MAVTRDSKEPVLAHNQHNLKFARARYAEAISALLQGETAEGLSMLRDLVHAEITFKELVRQTGPGEKTLQCLDMVATSRSTRSADSSILSRAAEDGRIAAPLRVAPSGVSRLAGRRVKGCTVHSLAGWQASALVLPAG